jgi:N-acetylglutamate synthase-like GNAT family acetyltransferase
MDPSPAYVLRPATVDDAAAVAACVNAAYEKYVARNGLLPAPMRDDYAQVIGECDVTVAEHDGEVVGVLVVREAAEGFLLDNVAVRPDWQGTGLGRRLLELTDDKALSLGYDSVYLYTQEIMTENQALYRRIGYVEYARRHELGLDRVYLRKPLAPGA